MKGLVMLCLFAYLTSIVTLSFGGEAVDLRKPECRVTTSSVLNNQFRYKGEKVLDNNLQTAWVEGAAGHGIGEWIQIQFARPWDVAHVGIIPGYAKRAAYRNLFFENNRIRSAALYLNQRIEKKIELYYLDF